VFCFPELNSKQLGEGNVTTTSEATRFATVSVTAGTADFAGPQTVSIVCREDVSSEPDLVILTAFALVTG
jgi:hypothetical protein